MVHLAFLVLVTVLQGLGVRGLGKVNRSQFLVLLSCPYLGTMRIGVAALWSSPGLGDLNVQVLQYVFVKLLV